MPMYSACGSAVLLALGFPIRESADHRLFSASPRLIAAVHALHRLLVPRHPPCALPILTVITRSDSPKAGRARGDTRLLAWLCSFQGPRRGAPPGLGGGLSKLNSMRPAATRAPGARSGRRFGSRPAAARGGDLGCAGAECACRLNDRSSPGASLERR